MKKITILTLVIFGNFQLVICQLSYYTKYMQPFLSENEGNGFIHFKVPNSFNIGSRFQYYKERSKDSENDMILTEHTRDSILHFDHHKYSQTYKGVPIQGAGCIEHYDSRGNLLFINSKHAIDIKLDPNPKITTEEVLTRLLTKLFKVANFAWLDPELERQHRIDMKDSNATYMPVPELILALDHYKNLGFNIAGERNKLAYKIKVMHANPFTATTYYVDANTGDIIRTEGHIFENDPASVYNYGTRILDTQWRGGFNKDYILYADDETRKIHTKKKDNPNRDIFWWTTSNTTDKDDNWGDSYLTETTTHYFATTCWDFYRQRFGRTGMDNHNTEVRVRTQLNQLNALFSGSDKIPYLHFGKTDEGNDLGLDPSIVAHEYHHGIDNYTAGLIYKYESGALNESFSDIFGTTVQAAMLDNNWTDWELGNSVNGIPTRSMKDPNSMGNSYDQNGNMILDQPDTYLGHLWYSGEEDEGGVHVNSGVQNHWFYLLSDGGSGKNDLNNYYKVDAIGITKASIIAFYAHTLLMMSSSQYSDARSASILAAQMIYGDCSLPHFSTANAWYAVGIGKESECESVTELNESDLIAEIKLYPNPSNGNAIIYIPCQKEKQIYMYDVTGQLVHEMRSKEMTIPLNLSALPDGIYTVRIQTENTTVTNKSFFKNEINTQHIPSYCWV